MDDKNLLQILAKQCLKDSQSWFPSTGQVTCPEEQVKALVHHTLSMCGEAGEVANIVKKLERGDKNLDDEMLLYSLSDEITDVLIYLLNLAGLLNIDLLTTYLRKRNINEQRFGRGSNAR